MCCRMKVSLPDPAMLTCFDSSAACTTPMAGSPTGRGPTYLLNDPAFVAHEPTASGEQPAILIQIETSQVQMQRTVYCWELIP